MLLLHELPDGSRHYDWLVERDGDSAAGLVTFRVGERIDAAPARFEAVRIADHRREYLSYEGPVSGGRGVVTRVAEGEIRIETDGAEGFGARGRLGVATGLFEGTPRQDGTWEFRFVAVPG